MKTHYVAFVDVLGFAALVDRLDVTEFSRLREYWTKGLIPPSTAPGYALVQVYESFTRGFAEWHRFVALDKNRRGGDSHIESFLFSDSCFVGSENVMDIIDFCRAFLHSMIGRKVAVRAGIGAGTFLSLDLDTKRAASGDLLVQCPFAGSAVVRAYRAESSGLRGIRCFVHPSVIEAVLESTLKHFVPLDSSEASPSASHELDLFVPGMDDIDPGLDELLRCLAEMERGADPRYAEYYSNTRVAIERMTQLHDFSQ